MFFTIVIPVRDNHRQLLDCLESLRTQAGAPEFEVVVIDDGSADPVSGDIANGLWFPVRVMRQIPLGIAAARNAGIAHAMAEVILFIDSDVTLEPDFLRRLAAVIADHPEEVAFQPLLASGKANMVERMEGLRLGATLRAMDDGTGHVDYANTSAFALRRPQMDFQRDLFDPALVRGEDTLMLANLLSHGHVPRFVNDAKAIHRPRLSLHAYILKHFSIGYYTAQARSAIQKVSPKTLLRNDRRKKVFHNMLSAARADPADMAALPLITLTHALERAGRITHRVMGLKPGRGELLGLPVDCVRENELLARIMSAIHCGTGMRITYLTAWSLVQAQDDAAMTGLLHDFDICYADGMGVVLCSLLLCGQRLHKVTANNFITKLCEQASLEAIPVALVGADQQEIAAAAQSLLTDFPELKLVGISHGYLCDEEEEAALNKKIAIWNPRLVIVGMGQPIQEKWTRRTSEALPDSVFLCVGGLFDYLSGAKPTPPKIVRTIGLEWLFILLWRPRQFWKRYVIGLPMLALYMVREFARKCFFPKRSDEASRS